MRGVLLTVLAVLLLVGISACFKFLAESYPPLQIVWARYFFAFVVILVLFPRRVPRLFASRHTGLQLLRGVTAASATLLAIYALRHISIAEMVAITFIAPLLTIALAGTVLGERADARLWTQWRSASAACWSSSDPGLGGLIQWAALLPLLMALFYAVGQLIIRSIGYLENPATSLAYQTVVGLALCSAALPWVWVVPASVLDLGVFVLSGVCGAVGHYCMIRAFERGRRPGGGALHLRRLIWAMVVGLVVFGDIPDPWMVLGAATVAASGLYILYRERA